MGCVSKSICRDFLAAIAPTIAELAEDDEAFTRINLLMLRNPTLINVMDGCRSR